MVAMSGPLISIILPIYNAAPWLSKAIQSVAYAAKGGRAEVIAVDDGSTDGSPAILRKIDIPRVPIHIIENKENQGIVYSLNRALDFAQGDLLARMDADDFCMPERFMLQWRHMEEQGLDLCGSWIVEFGQGLARTVRFPHTELAARTAMLFQNSICHPTAMARRAVFERYRYRNEYSMAEDYDLFSRAMSDFKIGNIPKVLLRYRRHSGQITQAKRTSVEAVSNRIRLQILAARGIQFSEEQGRIHNLIRGAHSITHAKDLELAGEWLLKLYFDAPSDEARRVIAEQWIRACIRAAPLGPEMWHIFRSSRLCGALAPGAQVYVDLLALSLLRLRYDSRAFLLMRRYGLSA